MVDAMKITDKEYEMIGVAIVCSLENMSLMTNEKKAYAELLNKIHIMRKENEDKSE